MGNSSADGSMSRKLYYFAPFFPIFLDCRLPVNCPTLSMTIQTTAISCSRSSSRMRYRESMDSMRTSQCCSIITTTRFINFRAKNGGTPLACASTDQPGTGMLTLRHRTSLGISRPRLASATFRPSVPRLSSNSARWWVMARYSAGLRIQRCSTTKPVQKLYPGCVPDQSLPTTCELPRRYCGPEQPQVRERVPFRLSIGDKTVKEA